MGGGLQGTIAAMGLQALDFQVPRCRPWTNFRARTCRFVGMSACRHVGSGLPLRGYKQNFLLRKKQHASADFLFC
jgi:hypothetical protein